MKASTPEVNERENKPSSDTQVKPAEKKKRIVTPRALSCFLFFLLINKFTKDMGFYTGSSLRRVLIAGLAGGIAGTIGTLTEVYLSKILKWITTSKSAPFNVQLTDKQIEKWVYAGISVLFIFSIIVESLCYDWI
ncbi:MAG: hypothetical protein HQK89_15620 [Nitrospirae bacterium]|nr:hypothetical protein [Nitrospirota bacterium]